MRPALWEDVSGAALNWLYERLPQFRLPPAVTGLVADQAAVDPAMADSAVDPATRPGESRELLLKPLGELAQLCVCVLREAPAGSEQRQLAREMLDFAWEQTGRGELFTALAHDEPQAVHPVETYGPFAEAGLRNPEFEEYVRFLATTRTWWLAEQQPTRALALWNSRRRMDGPYVGEVGYAEEPGLAEATRRTWLGGLAEPWAFEARTGYALTHHVFHITNWGALPEQLSPEVRDHLALWLPAWLDCCVAGRHWDLTGELLAVAAILPAPHAGSVPVAEVWEAYASAQEADGAYVELDGTQPEAEAAAVGEPAGWDGSFRLRYHATVVAALAAVLAHARHHGSHRGDQRWGPRGTPLAVRAPSEVGREMRGAAPARTARPARSSGSSSGAPPVPLSFPVSGGEHA